MPRQVNRGCGQYTPSIFMQKEGKMKKRIIIILLSLIMVTGSTMGAEVRAEASTATVVTSVSVGKAILFLLALAGVSVASSSALDYNSYDFSAFENSLRTTNPSLYTKFELWKAGVTAGKTSLVLTRSAWNQFRDYVRSYFGVDTAVSTPAGSGSFSIEQLAIMLNNSAYYITLLYGQKHFQGPAYECIPVLIDHGGLSYACFMPTVTAFTSGAVPADGGVAIPVAYGDTMYNLNFGNYSTGRYSWYYQVYGSNFPWFAPSDVVGNSVQEKYQYILNQYYAGAYTTASEDVDLSPLEGEDAVATSTENTLVGAGSIAQEENGEIVIDGDIPLNLAGLNIDEWLKNLADSITNYQTAVKALGAEVVNTSTMTQEEITEIAQALNPAVAGTDYITGNYTVNLTDLFPFCIPFDLYKIIRCFDADPVAPSATITIPVGYDGNSFTWEQYEISLEDFSPVASVVRVFEYVLFIIGLMLITRKLIEG